ncbi:MAG: AAA family ATPase [Ekhidna sp.]|uniref:AAA family ATPase n=1 Tax=Ekhidna sp. TaxID=2608089 RepID=UPI0032EB40B5
MITTIKIKNIASYKREVKVENLSKANFFFGLNGSGKSTIVRWLYDQSQKPAPDMAKFENFDRSKLHVFDDHFVQKNFYEKTELDGIFSLDEKNEEIEQLIKDKRARIEAISTKCVKLEKGISSVGSAIDKCDKDSKEYVWSERNKIQNDFKKVDLEHSGSKQNNFDKVINLIKQGVEVPDPEELRANYQKYFNSEMVTIASNLTISDFDEVQDLEHRGNTLLNEVIIGNQDVEVARMIDELNLSSWVDEGRKQLPNGQKVCPFCQKQTIDDNLLKQFENYFDKTRETKINIIKEFKAKYEQAADVILDGLVQLDGSVENPSEVKHLRSELQKIKNSCVDMIEKKCTKPNERFSLESWNDFFPAYSRLLEEIEKHNEDVKRIVDIKTLISNSIWNLLAARSKDHIIKKGNEKKTLQLENDKKEKELVDYRIEIKELEEEILDLQKKTVNTEQAVNEINALLDLCGFVGFKIQKQDVSEDNIVRYFLKREDSNDPNVFRTLSEGEKNFVAFLYFFKTCTGNTQQNEGLKKRIIVIDDPVTSMDSQAMFTVSSIIRLLLKPNGRKSSDFERPDLAQVFVLTHNMYFYKEVSFFQRIIKEQAHFLVTKIDGQSEVISKKNRTFIESDYVLLWTVIKGASDDPTMSERISILNAMRRIIHSYLSFNRLDSEWGVLEKLDIDSGTRIILNSLLSELNEGSHGVSSSDDLYYSRIADESLEKILSAFKLFFSEIGAEKHFERMMEEES